MGALKREVDGSLDHMSVDGLAVTVNSAASSLLEGTFCSEWVNLKSSMA